MKAIIHIGTPKTGTSAIQNFLAMNRENLKTNGIFIPTTDHLAGCHVELGQATFIPTLLGASALWINPFFKEGYTIADQNNIWKKYRDEIETNCNKDDLVIFSYEALTGFVEQEIVRVNELMKTLFDDIIVVLYLRRQPECLISHYGSGIYNGAVPQENFFDQLNQSSFFICFFVYHKIVERWSIFGKDKLKIRIFDKREFHENDLLSDFAHTVGFDMTGLERGKNENVSLDSAETEYLRFLNTHIPAYLDSWTVNPDRRLINGFFWQTKEGRSKYEKPYHLNRNEAQQILDQYREGNDWIAREYLGREKLFDDDVSMYPEVVDSPHQLTLERSVEISAQLLKFHAAEIQRQQGVIEGQQGEIQNLRQEKDADVAEIQRLLLQNKILIYWHYYRCKVLAKLTFGKPRKHYKEKRDAFHEKVRQIRNLQKHK